MLQTVPETSAAAARTVRGLGDSRALRWLAWLCAYKSFLDAFHLLLPRITSFQSSPKHYFLVMMV